MTKLPVCSGGRRRSGRLSELAGSGSARRGSHVSLIKAGVPIVLTVPLHREVGPGLLWSLIRKAGLSVEEFHALLR